jgi:hypothetical protein
MDFVVCPMCGKSTSMRTFDPSKLDNDIYIQNMRGLGRGRGFQTENRRSALKYPDVTDPIKDRLLELCTLLYEYDILSTDDLTSAISQTPEDLTPATEPSPNDPSNLRTKVADTLGEDVDDWIDETGEDIDSFALLRYGTERLIESHGALQAELEERR